MIRLIQKRLIIPRGDTGTFSIPVLAGKDSNDVSIFTIFDPLTHKKIFEKRVDPVEGMLHITFTHGDTVNLPVGQYVWDIKFYTDPVFAEEQLVDGTEVDSYYALFNLPICEIRETGDNMLYGDDAPAATLAPDQIDLITRSLADIHTSMQAAIDSATAAEQSATSASDSATAAETSASSAIDAAASALENKNAAALSAQEAAASVASLFDALPTKISDLIDDSGHYIKPAGGIPASDLEETYLTSFTETDPTVPSWAKAAQKPEYTAVEVGAMATDHPANNITAGNIENWTKQTNLLSVDFDHNASDYWWTLTIPRNALWNIYNAPGTSGKLRYLYVPSTEGKTLVRLELPINNGKLALITDTPAWARAAQKPTYTAQEVGALPADTVIPVVPTNVSAFTNDAGYITGYTETDPTVPAWAKASTKPSYTAAEVGAPTVAEMNSAISTAIGNINSFDMAVVQELPTQNISTHTIYLVPKTGETNDVYDEYIYINNAWEMIGNTQIDLSNYVQKTQYATQANAGVIKVISTGSTGVTMMGVNSDFLGIYPAPITEIQSGSGSFRPITADRQHSATFYGLAKAAGDTTQAQSDNAVGTYTTEAKAAIRAMLGVATPADIPTNVSAFTNDAGYLTQHQDISGKANVADLATVATSGSYEDLSNKPTIPEVPVQDVQINGTSILSNGIADIPLADDTHIGAVKIHSDYGWGTTRDGYLRANGASTYQMRQGTDFYRPIVSANQHISIFYGLAKIAGHDEKDSTESVGTYTDAAKQAIQNMLGITNLISTEEFSTATAAHALNSTFMMGGKLYRATAAIVIGDAVVEGQNCEVVKADEVFVKNTDYAGYGTYGLVKLSTLYGVRQYQQSLATKAADSAEIKRGTDNFDPVVSATADSAAFYGLSKVAGVDLANETVTLGTYPETSKTAIRSLIGAAAASDIPSVPVQDIQVNSASIVNNGVANIPKAGYTDFGVVKVFDGYGIGMVSGGAADGAIGIACATDTLIKTGTSAYKAIVPAHQHESVFYGLTKAAGVDMASSSNAVGSYTNEAKTAIQSMLGIEVGTTCIETVSGATPTITAQPNVRYNCGEVSTISITPPASGTCDVFFTSGSTATVMTVPNTVKWPEWFDATTLETDTIYEIMITDGVYGSVMTWES